MSLSFIVNSFAFRFVSYHTLSLAIEPCINLTIPFMKIIFELFFCKKKYLLVGAWDMLWAGGAWFMDHGSLIMVQWIMDQQCMYVTPIRLDLLLNTNQISCYKGKWYVRRFDPDTVENGHIYSSVKEEEVFIYWVYLGIFCRYVRLRILWAGLIVFSNWIINKHSVWDITASTR